MLVVGYPADLAAQTNVFGFSKAWSYNETANLDGVNWQASAYDDSGWSSGASLLAVEGCGCLPQPITTPLSLGRTTYYFRTHFNYSDGLATAITFTNLIDDGAVFYLNGVEIQRVGMPAGAIAYGTFSSRNVNNATAYDVFTISGDLLTNLVNGDNVLAVEVHQLNAGSSDIVFGCAFRIISGDTGAGVTRGPYLQMGTHTNVVVRWRTDIATGSRVRFGTNLASLTSFAGNATITLEHEVNVTGLLPDTMYYYSVGTTNTALAGGDTNHFFVTSPLLGTRKPTRIWVLGDSGTADANQANVRNAYYNFTGSRHTDLWLMLGDNAYDDGTDTEYQAAVFDVYQTVLRKSVLWPTLGNHDTAQATAFVDTYPYFNMFTLPKNGEAGGAASGTEHYYSFDYGNIHFICLDSMTANRATNGAMAQWLIADLGTVTADWIIAFWHHPPYSKGSHNSDTEGELIQMRQNFLPILEAGGVDLVLAGHSHSYERSYLLDGHYGASGTLTPAMKLDAGSGRTNQPGAYKKQGSGPISHQGAVYVVAGSSGQTSGGSLNHPAMFISANNLGSLVIDISGNRLDTKFIRETGATVDYFTILKNDPPVADASATPPLVISPNNTNATVILDGSRSFDSDGDTLQYAWSVGGSPVANGVVAVTVLPVGTHSILLTVNDGVSVGTNSVTVEVITTSQAIERLIDLAEARLSRPQPFRAILVTAIASIERNNYISAVNQLLAFQNQVRAQVEPLDPAMAAILVQGAQEIVDVLSGGNTNPAGRPHGRFTSVATRPGRAARMEFVVLSGRHCIVEASSNLIDWEMIGVVKGQADIPVTFEDVNAAKYPGRFYRIVSP